MECRIWHDNNGKHSDWFVNDITIRDVETETKYYFLCDSWLSKTKGDKKVCKTGSSNNDFHSDEIEI